MKPLIDEIERRCAVNGGFRLHVWKTNGGEWQANVSGKTGEGWQCHTSSDLVDALNKALGAPVAVGEIDIEDILG